VAEEDAIPLPGVSSITTTDEWAAFFSAISTNGIVRALDNGIGGTLNGAARQVVAGAGAAMIEGFYKRVSSPTGVAIPAASAQNRVDRFVLRLDKTASAAANLIKLTVITGTPGTSTPPALTVSATVHDIPICRWTSTAAGGLESLVDERVFIGDRELHQFFSNARPDPSPPRLGIELDTGPRLMWATGAAWTYLGDVDTGDINLTAASGWTASGTLAGRKLNGVVDVELNLTRSGANVSESTATQLTTLPASLRPSRNKYFACVLTGDNFARCDVGTDGGIWLRHAFVTIPKSAEVRMTLTYIP
jgi:hypothetical protein